MRTPKSVVQVMIASGALSACMAQSPNKNGTASDAAPSTEEEHVCALDGDGYSFTLQGSRWINNNISASFMPDGTSTLGMSSSLHAHLDQFAPREVWQKEFAKALARWAAVSNINFRFVGDNGNAHQTSGVAQAENRFGDIRIGARDIGTSYTGLTTYPTNSGTAGGDSFFNTQKTYSVNSTRDILSIAMHEFGHSLGLGHTNTYGDVMYKSYISLRQNLSQDDINGIRAIYGQRVADSYDQAGANDSPATASSVTVNASGVTFLNGDITTAADSDHYSITVPSVGGNHVLSVSALGGHSLLTPALKLYDGQGNLLAESSAADYGQAALLQFSGVSTGGDFIIGVDGASDDEFGVGKYRLAVEFKATADNIAYAAPANLNPDSQESNDGLTVARYLGQTTGKTVSGLSAHWTWDDDYFSFKTAKSKVKNYEVSFSGANGPLVIEIFDASDVKIAESAPGASYVRFPVRASTTYKARVYSGSGQPTGYSLTVKKYN